MAKGYARLLWPLGSLARARGLLFPWVPVFIGSGVNIWFSLTFEPGAAFYIWTMVVFLSALAGYRFGPELGHPLMVIVLCVAAGVLASGYRAHAIAAPVLEFRYYGPVQGRVIDIDRSQSDVLRLTLDQVVLLDVAPDRTPKKVRISLHGDTFTPDPGQVVLMAAYLSAPEGPAEPSGFDFRRMAFFEQLGAVGYTRSPVVLWQQAVPGTQRINRLRTRLASAMMQAMPGQAGAFAAGAMTGDRSGISQDTVQALRDSNLAHLLAISGMNMAFITGFVFMLVRYSVALVSPLALRINAKKLGAVVAFGVALFYLQLSGANVATQRAFLMVVVMLGAVLLDRRGLTMRSVAMAGTVLLLAEPESLGEPGFQLSFAATVVLIAGFEALDRQILREKLPRWLIPVFVMVLTSVLAGLATAPFAAATFNRFTDYGLLANLLTAPVMSILMAAGAMAALLAPFSLAAPAFWVMDMASRWILFVAHWVSGLGGAVTPIMAPGPLVIPLITLAGVWAVLWRGPWRFVAALPMLAAVALWITAVRPTTLISSDGALVGIMTGQGRALSAPRGAGFAAESWLQDDGDLASQQEAAARPAFNGAKSARSFVLGEWRAVALSGKGAAAAAACADYDLVIMPAAIAPLQTRPQGCLLIDRTILARSGALALRVQGDTIVLTPARWAQRIWMGPKPVLALRQFKKARSGSIAADQAN